MYRSQPTTQTTILETKQEINFTNSNLLDANDNNALNFNHRHLLNTPINKHDDMYNVASVKTID